MKHEDAVGRVHPGARDFHPVRNALRTVVGWTFEIPRLNEEGDRIESSVDYGWVTVEGEASSDRLDYRSTAARSLKAYRSVRRSEPVDIMGKRA